MTNPLTFYSVTQTVVDGLKAKFGADTKIATDKETGAETVTGKVPGFGQVSANFSYSPPSGQLSIDVTQRPPILTLDTIDAWLRNQIATLQVEVATEEADAKATESTPPVAPVLPPSPAPVAPPAPTPVPVVTPASPEKKKGD